MITFWFISWILILAIAAIGSVIVTKNFNEKNELHKEVKHIIDAFNYSAHNVRIQIFIIGTLKMFIASFIIAPILLIFILIYLINYIYESIMSSLNKKDKGDNVI